MIGGIDIRIPSRMGDLSLEIAVRAIRQIWADAVYENGLTGEKYDRFEQIPFGCTEEIFVYRDRESASIWDIEGAVPEASNTMIHLIYDAGWLTAVVDERTEEMNAIIKAIESGLAGRPGPIQTGLGEKGRKPRAVG